MPVVLVEKKKDVCIITLNRPERMNSVDAELREALIAALAEANEDASVRAVVITGAGDQAFSAGQDLKETSGMRQADLPTWMGHLQAMYQAVRSLDKGCVVACNGVAVGAGLQIGLCADLRVGFPEMKIGQPEVKAGLASVLGSYFMTHHCGIGANKTLSLLGELIDGTRAYEIGLLTHLVPKETVMSTAMDLATRLAAIAPTAMRTTKRRFRAATQREFDEACAEGVRAQTECYDSGEPQAIQRTFLEKRASKIRK